MIIFTAKRNYPYNDNYDVRLSDDMKEFLKTVGLWATGGAVVGIIYYFGVVRRYSPEVAQAEVNASP